ncbi:hypothetical protein Gotur_005729 [Gossypium turneri]
MTGLFRSKSCGLVGLTEFNPAPPSPFFNPTQTNSVDANDDEEKMFDDEDEEEEEENGCYGNPIATRARRGNSDSTSKENNQLPFRDILTALLRKSLVTCSVDTADVSSMDISLPTEVKHVSHVTFDRFNGFLGLPIDLQPDVPRRVPSARFGLQSFFFLFMPTFLGHLIFLLNVQYVFFSLSSASVFGVSAKSMQCSYDARGNSVPTILLMMQKRLYAEGGLKAEGIFRINADNTQEEYVRNKLNRGIVPRGIDVHCLAGLIKAWLRELPSGVLDSLTPEQVMHCNTEDDCIQLTRLIPSTEAALLDWAINLMADVVQHEQYNKMDARNIAMVFAPNMTQMADPLTALIHAVQVMNFLKTLILKTLREREELAAKGRSLPSYSDSPTAITAIHTETINSWVPHDEALDGSALKEPHTAKFFRSATLSRLECSAYDKLWSFQYE